MTVRAKDIAGLDRSGSAMSDPHESRWDLREGDEIVPGRSAIKRLGGGLRYEAYLAWDDHLRSLVVVKVVRPGLVEDRHTLEGLESEVKLLERLAHPVLLRGFGAELDGPRPHVVLEHLEGPRLSTLLRKYGPLLPEQLVPLAVQLCSAIHYLGREGVVHLDVKPSNIIMGGPPRLIDLSVARTLEQCGRLSSAVGTDGYMAPEQCRPDAGVPVGGAADVWGLGVTLYRAVTGERPFTKGDPGSNEPSERWPQLVEEPAPLDDGVSRAIADPIMACLTHDPADRPNPGEVADALERVLETLPRPRLSRLKPRVARS
ncbi:MAG TPA: serine/threonine-protein kinase [Solirubrobacterales bacterium]|nr:serine/threonine-protein kinase [Solirubrobacterales bacterium]